MDSELATIITDEEWPAVLEQRKIDAAAPQEKLERNAKEREAAKAAGYGEWYKSGGLWCIAVAGANDGSIVPVRRRDGTIRHYQLGEKISEKLYVPGQEVPESEASMRLISQSSADKLRHMYLQ